MFSTITPRETRRLRASSAALLGPGRATDPKVPLLPRGIQRKKHAPVDIPHSFREARSAKSRMEDQIAQVVGIAGCSEEKARFYLESSNGDVAMAVQAFFGACACPAPLRLFRATG